MFFFCYIILLTFYNQTLFKVWSISSTVSTHTFQVQFQHTHSRYSFNTHISGAVSTHTFQVQFQHTIQMQFQHTHFNSLVHLQTKTFSNIIPQRYLKMTQEWREIFYESPISDLDLKKYFDTGFLYFCGRDHRFRPLIIIRADRCHQDILDDNTIFARMFGYTCEYMLRYMFVPGLVETYLIFWFFFCFTSLRIFW